MSGIALETDPLIFTVSGMTSSSRHFGFSSKLLKTKEKNVFQNALDLLSTNPVLVFACDKPLPVKSCSNLIFDFPQNWSKSKNKICFE